MTSISANYKPQQQAVSKQIKHQPDKSINKSKMTTTQKEIAGGGALAVASLAAFLIHRKIKNVPKPVTQEVIPQLKRKLANGKEVVKTITQNPEGKRITKLELLDENGVLLKTKEKLITHSVTADGKNVSNVKSSIISPDGEKLTKERTAVFSENLENGNKYFTLKYNDKTGLKPHITETNKYYSKDGNELLTSKIEYGEDSGGIYKIKKVLANDSTTSTIDYNSDNNNRVKRVRPAAGSIIKRFFSKQHPITEFNPETGVPVKK